MIPTASVGNRFMSTSSSYDERGSLILQLYRAANHATRPRGKWGSSFLLRRYRHAVDGENRPIRYAGGHSFPRIEEPSLPIEAFRRRIREYPQFSPPVFARQPN